MKKLIVLSSLLLTLTIHTSVFPQIQSSDTVSYYNGSQFVETTNRRNVSLLHSVDLRYINYLYKQKRIKTMLKVFNEYLDMEDKLGFKPNFRIYSYIYNERQHIAKTKKKTRYTDINILHNDLAEVIKLKKDTKDIFPRSVIIGGLNYYHSEIMNRQDAIAYFFKELVYKKVSIGEYQPAKNGYVIPITNDNNGETIFILYIYKIKNSIYTHLNNTYQISAIFYPGHEASINQYVKWKGITTEQELVYGIRSNAGLIKKGDTCRILVNNLRVREKPVLTKTNIITLLKEDDIVRILGVGKYTVINNIGANWVRIKTADGKIGWCFGAPLYMYHNYEEWSDKYL